MTKPYNNYKDKLSKIKTFIFDIDGVLTDGTVIVSENGEQYRTMNVKDGYALQLAIKKGFRIIIISGGYSEAIIKRFEYLGVKEVFLGVENKHELFLELLDKGSLNQEEVLYMGDDIPDYKIMKDVFLPSCPRDAVKEIKAISEYVSPLNGGYGCVRDIIEQVLMSQKIWFDDEAFKW
ncbi:MAG: 3-deoxy-D-manno-octulosonate 8-phosphate phosphatase [Bacteroidetes bacterium GWE2_29_8]|nr:MAG: 3-deoxy-D-manno-octulosonate 8-phosphate phosphatase [Bacteroidetes bacterium GWE2_29_8]OFY22206.1 MAG: 3-deoxy-D-manno-octulosonate 8-phosphate phosphatase [Bacteroidetes bacterium GWF2_29_10]